MRKVYSMSRIDISQFDDSNRDLAVQTAIMQLSVQGYKPYQIQQELNISQGEFARNLEVVTTAWRQSINTDSAEFFGKILQGYESVITAAWEGFKRSCEPKEKTRTKASRVGDESGETLVIMEKHESSEGQSGDPKFLATISATWAHIARLTGQEKAVNLMLQQNTYNVTESKDEFSDRLAEFERVYAETHERTASLSDGNGVEKSLDSQGQSSDR